jgi:hypothetical protein
MPIYKLSDSDRYAYAWQVTSYSLENNLKFPLSLISTSILFLYHIKAFGVTYRTSNNQICILLALYTVS